jgi:hypothetical protein
MELTLGPLLYINSAQDVMDANSLPDFLSFLLSVVVNQVRLYFSFQFNHM